MKRYFDRHFPSVKAYLDHMCAVHQTCHECPLNVDKYNSCLAAEYMPDDPNFYFPTYVDKLELHLLYAHFPDNLLVDEHGRVSAFCLDEEREGD